MLFIRIIRYFCGYVSFTCQGGFPERFINLCSLNGIVLWDTKTTENGLRATTYIRCFRKIRPCVKRSGMKLRVTDKKGFPFLISGYLRRKGLIAGIIASILLVLWLGNFIWTVDVKGNVNFTIEQVIEIGEKYGVYPGAKRKNIDVSATKDRIKTDFDDISWFTVNLYGANASFEIAERFAKTNIYDKDTPCNIVSQVDGEVIEIQALSGQPEVRIGTAVKEGDLLISGVTLRQNGSTGFVHARGSAVIRTSEELKASIMHTITVKSAQESKIKYTINIFGLSIPLSFPEGEKTAGYAYTLEFRNRLLPVSITREFFNIYTDKKMQISESRAKLLASHNIMQQEKEIMENAETEKKIISLSSDSRATEITANYTNHKRTGIEKYFEISTE